MTTYPQHVDARRPHVSYWLVAVIALAAALVALGAWVLVDRYAGGDSATQDATTLIDDLNAAFSTGDANAIPSLYASNAVMRSFGVGETYAGVKAIRTNAGCCTIERLAPVTVEGEYATSFMRIAAPGWPTVMSISVFQIKDGKIVRQWNFVPGQTSPFDNAVLP